jgi:hypothetical protein
MKQLILPSILLCTLCTLTVAADFNYNPGSAIVPTQTEAAKASFSDGYKAGYKKAYPLGLCPIPPIPPIGKNTYEDGYGMGYAQGVLDKG